MGLGWNWLVSIPLEITPPSKFLLTNERYHTTKYYYSPLGWIAKVVTPLGINEVQYEYDPIGRIKKEIDGDGNYVLYQYDYLNRVKQEASYDASGTKIGQVDHVYYHNYNNTQANRQKTTIAGDSDSPDIVTAVEINKHGFKTNYAYDSLNRLVTEQLPLDTTVYVTKDYLYDRNSNLQESRISNNVPGQTSSQRKVGYEYDNRNRLVKVNNYEGNAIENYIQYEYDAAGNRTKMLTGDGRNATVYTYDNDNRLTVTRDPLGQTESYTYYNNNNLKTKKDRNGRTSTYSYDGAGRLLSTAVTTAEGNVRKENTYSSTGNLVRQKEQGAEISYRYDSLGRMTGVTEPGAIAKTYGYNLNNQVINFQLKQNNTTRIDLTYTYDNLDRLSSVAENSVQIAAYNYDQNGNRIGQTYNNGTSTDYTYNKANQILTLTNQKGAAIISQYSYQYYTDGNMYRITDNDNKNTTFVYDGLGRLKSESFGDSYTKTYAYDASNNRSRMVVSGQGARTVTYHYDSNNRLLKETSVSPGKTDEYLYAYDPNGNQLSRKSVLEAEFSLYDEFNRLIQTAKADKTIDYAYRPDDLRHSKAVNGVKTTHIWDGSNIVMELDNSNQVQNRYLRGNGLIALDSVGVKSYYYHNGLGDVVQLADEAGVVTNSYSYDAFGNEIESPGQGETQTVPQVVTKTESGAAVVTDGAIVVSLPSTAKKVTIMTRGRVVISYNASLFGAGVYCQFDGPLLLRLSWKSFRYEGGYVNGDGFKFKVLQANGTVLDWVAEYDTVSISEPDPDMDSDTNPFRYRGEYFDEEINTIYLRARYYSPATGRFSAEDSYWHPGNMIYGDSTANAVPVVTAIMQSSNLYTYTLNNPVLWTDQSGLTIVPVYNNNRKDQEVLVETRKIQYERAIEYLKGSSTGNALIEKLEKSDIKFYIMFIGYGNDSRYPTYLHDTMTILWDPARGLLMSDGAAVSSASIALAHELGHAAQHLDGELDAVIENTTRRGLRKVENANLERYETPIAEQLGEPTRKNYDAHKGMQRMNNSTHYRTSYRIGVKYYSINHNSYPIAGGTTLKSD